MPQTQTDTQPAMTPPPPEQISATARWIHAHKSSTSDNLLGYTVYQYLRSAVASVPYGFSMAGTWLGFQKAQDFFGGMAKAEELGSMANYGKSFFGSPLMRTGAMIATSFTLYRATSKIAKWANEYLFNPEDSLEDTQIKLEKLPEMLKAKAREVYLPEAHSTFISAFVLSALVTLGAQHAATPYMAEAAKETKELLGGSHSFNTKGWKHFWDKMILDPKSKFVEQTAVNSMAYSLFFELGDRRFKDKQISRGLWGGRASSLGSSSRANPSLLQADLQDNGSAQPSVTSPTIGEPPIGSRMNDSLSVLTSEPSALRFALRRLLPTAIGIAGYTALKFRGGKLFFGDFVNTPKAIEEMGTLKGFLRNSYAEGAATSLFFMVPWVSDKYAPAFDSAVNRLEAAVSGRSLEDVVAGYQPKAANKHNAPDPKIAVPAGEHGIAQTHTAERTA